MDDNTAIELLTQLLKKEILSEEERESVSIALGVLTLTVSTSESYIKKLKAKQESNLSL